MSRPIAIKHPLKRMYSNNICETQKNEDSRFTDLITATANKDIKQFRRVFNESLLPVSYKEPAKGNRFPLHYAAKYSFNEGVKFLLKSGADCNCLDENGQTPLHMAAVESSLDVCKELLNAGALICIVDKRGRSALHLAVIYAYDSGNEVEENMVQLVQLLLQKGACQSTKDNEGRVPIHFAAQSGFAAGIRLLISGNGCGTISSRDSENRTPLHHAVISAKSLEVVKVLIDFRAHIDAIDNDGKTALHLITGRKITQVDEEFDIACLDLLLSFGASVDILDGNNQTPMALALTRTMFYNKGSSRDFLLTIVQMLVAKGSRISCCFTMWRMIESFPSLLYQTLNRSITANSSVATSTLLQLDFDVACLLHTGRLKESLKLFALPQNSDVNLPSPLKTDTDVSFLHYLIVSGNKGILTHPLCRTFLHLKWMKIRKFFAVNFILNCLFVLSISGYVFFLTGCELINPEARDTEDVISNRSESIVGVSKNTSNNFKSSQNGADNDIQEWAKCLQHDISSSRIISWISLSTLYVVIFLREFIQFVHHPLQYIFSIRRLMFLALILFIPFVVLEPCPCDEIWRKQVGAVTVVIGWISLLLSLGQFPAFGVYIVMFSRVASNVLKLLGLFMLLLIAFAFGFHVLLRPYKTFSTLFTSLSTIFVMMTGELDYEAVFIDVGKQQVGFLCIAALLLFIFLVYIILSNLLVGLAVSDMTAIRKRSELMRLTTQVELMVQFESMVRSYLLPKTIEEFLKQYICLYKLSDTSIISIKPNEKRGWVTSTYRLLVSITGKKLLNKIFESLVDGFLPPQTEPDLPKKLLKTSLSIALRQFEISKRDRLLRQGDHATRLDTLIRRMPMPIATKEVGFSGHACLERFHRKSNIIFEEQSENSDYEDNLVSESQPFLSDKSRVLTLRKSSRRNLLGGSLRRGMSFYGDTEAISHMEANDLRQVILGLRSTLDKLDESINNKDCYSRQSSMGRRRYTTDDESNV